MDNYLDTLVVKINQAIDRLNAHIAASEWAQAKIEIACIQSYVDRAHLCVFNSPKDKP